MLIFVVKINCRMKHIGNINIKIVEQSSLSDSFFFKDDFSIFTVKCRPIIKHPFKVETYGFILCKEGTSRGTIDLSPFELKKGMMIMIAPGQLLTTVSISEDFEGMNVLMSPRFIDSLGLPYDFELSDMVKKNSIVELSESLYESLYTCCQMFIRLLSEERPYQMETLKHLTCAYFYGLNSYLLQLQERAPLASNELLVKNFMEKVRKHYHEERKVTFYAQELCITPGYLSTIVSEVTGKTASGWIEDFVSMEAKALLKSTNMTIQQISDSLNFPSQSFFGKFFKRVVGVSPREYRSSDAIN